MAATMNMTIDCPELNKPDGLLAGDDGLAGVLPKKVAKGEQAGSGLQTAFVLGGVASLPFALMIRPADRLRTPRDEGGSSALTLA